VRPFKLLTGDYVRCGSRIKSRCAPCAELYRSDWAAIARSGIFDGPVADFKFYLLTLTAPSFGRVHRVPRSAEKVQKCGCGELHTVADAPLRGVPLDASTYDYAGQVAWNRDSGVLWDRTRKRLRDRWDSLEYFQVREWQDRGVLHLHLLVRIARFEAPDSVRLPPDRRIGTAEREGSCQVWPPAPASMLLRWGAEHPPVAAGCWPVAALDGVPVPLRLVVGWLAGREPHHGANQSVRVFAHGTV
jgi:hypothetical protein